MTGPVEDYIVRKLIGLALCAVVAAGGLSLAGCAPHFVVYINNRDIPTDDNVTIGEFSQVFIEVAHPANNDPVKFRLSQAPLSGAGLVQFIKEDGVTPEPMMEDGKTARIYQIQPNGPPVEVLFKGLRGGGTVSITATEVETGGFRPATTDEGDNK